MKKVQLPEQVQSFLKEQDIYLLADYQVKTERPVKLQKKNSNHWGFSFWNSKVNLILFTITMHDTGEILVIESDGQYQHMRILANFFKGSFDDQLAIC